MFDWNDIRALLAVARSGSTTAAARALGVNQTTVARRLEALERALGARVVELSQAGASLTEFGADLLRDAEAMERAALAVQQRAESHRRSVGGTLRVTASEMAASWAITPLLSEFRGLHPDIALELVITDAPLDVASGEADVAIRGGYALEDSDLIARKVHSTAWALYCSRDYATRAGRPATYADLAGHALIGGDSEARQAPGLAEVLRDAPGVAPNLRSTSMTTLFASIRAGLGIGPMPCAMADTEADLVQVFPPRADSMTHTWIVTRPDLKDAPRVRAFIEFFAPRIMALGRESEGRAEKARALRDP